MRWPSVLVEKSSTLAADVTILFRGGLFAPGIVRNAAVVRHVPPRRRDCARRPSPVGHAPAARRRR